MAIPHSQGENRCSFRDSDTQNQEFSTLSLEAKTQRDSQTGAWLTVLFIFVTLCLFFPAIRFNYLNYDDPIYFTHTADLIGARSDHPIFWAFTSTYGYYQPLTWLSIFAERALLGPDPSHFHLTNIWLHIANSIAVLTLAQRFLSNRLTQFAAAASFSWHPVALESVVWLSERKGLLASFFALSALLAFCKYLARRQRSLYFLSLLSFLASLLSKPSWIALPLVLAILRTRETAPRRQGNSFLAPILPFLFLSAVFSLLTLFGEHEAGALAATADMDLFDRIGFSIVALYKYTRLLCCPTALTIYYPYPDTFPLYQLLLGATVLTGILVLILSKSTSRRFAVVLIISTLAPALMPLKVGSHFLALRYLYGPLVGFSILLFDWLSRRVPQGESLAQLILIIIPISLAICTRTFLPAWRNSETVWANHLAHFPNSVVGRINYSAALLAEHRTPEAIPYIRAVIDDTPFNPYARYNMAIAAQSMTNLDEARKFAASTQQILRNQNYADPLLHAKVKRLINSLNDSYASFQTP